MRKILVLILFCLVSCQKNLPEETLLKSFQQELEALTRYQNDYVAYVSYQVQHFEKKQKETTEQIKSINKNFVKLSDLEKNKYQREWQKKFQPVIDVIYQKTQILLTHQRDDLTPGDEAKIQELMVKLEFKQKQVTDVKLLPQFFRASLRY